MTLKGGRGLQELPTLTHNRGWPDVREKLGEINLNFGKQFLIEYFKGKMKAPHHLSTESKKIYKQLTLDWDFDHSALILLRTALEAYDRLQTARKEIDREGTTITTPTGHMKPHPSLRIEKEARAGFLMAWRMLNLNIEPPGEIGRPGGH